MRELVSSSDLKARFDTQLRGSTPKELRRLWDDIVEAYLLKGLTYDTDRLPALAGIAQLFSERGLGRYVNGTWEPTLVPGLFWVVNWSLCEYHGIVAKRSADPRVPSWSWASVSGAFRYTPSTGAIEGLDVVDIPYHRETPNPLADVSVKAITLCGILTKARAWSKTDPEKNPSYHHRLIQVPEAKEHQWLVDIASELTCNADSPMDVYIVRGTKGPGLVLRRVEGARSTYQRLGLIEGYPPIPSEYDITTIQLV